MPAAARGKAVGRVPWGRRSATLQLGRFLKAAFTGLCEGQEEVLTGGVGGAPDDVPRTDLLVRVWRAEEAQRPEFVRFEDFVPIRWETRSDGLRIAERFFVAAVSPSLPREADLWTFSDRGPQIAAAVTNFTRVVLSSGFAFPGTYLLHSSAFALKSGKAALFYGPSGAGKSTLGSFVVGAGYSPLSDDLNLVEMPDGGGVFIQPFPWAGDHGPRRWHDLLSYPLGGIFRLEKGERHEVAPLRPAQAVAGLASCSPFVNAEPGRYGQLLDSLEALVRRVPVFTLRFRKDAGFLDLVEEALR